MHKKENIKILVVDDSETHRQFLTYVLSHEKYQVFEAKDGSEAIKIAKHIIPDLIITDILMPGMDGYEMIAHLKKEKELDKIKIILYTAQYQKQEAIKLAKLFGISHYLDKPAEKKQLLAMVAQALSKKEQHKKSIMNADEISKQHLDLVNKKLFKQVQDLEKLKFELENRISERTRELEILNKKFQEDSIHDPLTGLFNRRYLHETLIHEISREGRTQKQFAVVILDIDHFKNINDQYGHSVGDIALSKIADYLKQHMRLQDVVCRFGGEEFVLVLVDQDDDVIFSRLESIREDIQKMEIMTTMGKIPSITVSMGYSTFPNHGKDEDTLIEAADEALYHAKETGRNRVISYRNLSKGLKKKI